ncbi:hypothetical protein IEQ34_009858 [Dendrobium chrysotoxum]|uniref:Uncharacterized protein n=1 Tax=Dendrobium chrysotoxum TaxID=161865 RepID=A0AAV7H2Q2_DENCH|nr:hypothetical protein IEQ34_009858 [Dendrobium chrysotoxum]
MGFIPPPQDHRELAAGVLVCSSIFTVVLPLHEKWSTGIDREEMKMIKTLNRKLFSITCLGEELNLICFPNLVDANEFFARVARPRNQWLLSGSSSTPKSVVSSCMADLELDHGFVYDDQCHVDILNSPFFDLNLEIDQTVEESMTAGLNPNPNPYSLYLNIIWIIRTGTDVTGTSGSFLRLVSANS